MEKKGKEIEGKGRERTRDYMTCSTLSLTLKYLYPDSDSTFIFENVGNTNFMFFKANVMAMHRFLLNFSLTFYILY